MILSDSAIVESIENGSVAIDPFKKENVRPASVSLHLGEWYSNISNNQLVDLSDERTYPKLNLRHIERTGLVIQPKEFLLCGTLERLRFGRRHAGIISNLTGLARLGLGVELSGFVSPGFGESAAIPLTLEIYNHSPSPIKLYGNMRICHLIIVALAAESTTSYDKHVGVHSSDIAPSGSRFFRFFESSDEE